jgi:uncharacterized membrane protein
LIQRFSNDLVGNSLAVIILLGMIISAIYIGSLFLRSAKLTPKPWINWLIPILALIGLGVAAYLAFVEVKKVAPICGPVGDCSSVQNSRYSKLFGVFPVGIVGVIGYISILIAWVIGMISSQPVKKIAIVSIWVMSWFGVLFSIYLTFLEPFVIGATCIWCISSAITITLLLWTSTPGALSALQIDDED